MWFSILTQLSFFVGAHAEELRSLFVAHEEQEDLEVTCGGNIESADFGALAVEMTMLIEKNVVDPEFRNWIVPQFKTTTEVDSVCRGCPDDGCYAEVLLVHHVPSVWHSFRHFARTARRLGIHGEKTSQAAATCLSARVILSASSADPKSLRLVL